MPPGMPTPKPVMPSSPFSSSPKTGTVHGIIIALALLSAVGFLVLYFKTDLDAKQAEMNAATLSAQLDRLEQRIMEKKEPEAMTKAEEWMPFAPLTTEAFSRDVLQIASDPAVNAFKRSNGALIPFTSEMIGKTITHAIRTALADGTEIVFFTRDTYDGTSHQWETFAWNQKTNEVILINKTIVRNDAEENYGLAVYGLSGSKLIFQKYTDNSPGPCACIVDSEISTFSYRELSTTDSQLKDYVPTPGFKTYMDRARSDCQAAMKTNPECSNT